MKKSKKILSLLLAVVMLVSALSAGFVASAADVPAPNYSKRVTEETMTELIATLDTLAADNLNPLIEESLFTNATVGAIAGVLCNTCYNVNNKPGPYTYEPAYGLVMCNVLLNFAMSSAGLYEKIADAAYMDEKTGNFVLTELGASLLNITKDDKGEVTGCSLTEETLNAIRTADYGVTDKASFAEAMKKLLAFPCSSVGLPLLLKIPIALYDVLPVLLAIIEESVGIDLPLPAKAEMDAKYNELKAQMGEPESFDEQWPIPDGDYVVGLLVDSVMSVLDKFMAAPATFLIDLLPNLANFVTGQNKAATATNCTGMLDLAGLVDMLASLMPMLGLPEGMIKINSATFDVTLKIGENTVTVPGTTLTNYTTDEEFKCIDVAGLVNALLPVIVDKLAATEGAPDLSALKGLELPAIDWALLAERGEKVKLNSNYENDLNGTPCFYTLVKADTEDSLMTVLDYVYKALIADAENFDALYKTLDAAIPASDSKATIMQVVGSLSNMSEEKVILTLMKLFEKNDDNEDPSTTDPSENPSEEPSENPSEKPSENPTQKPSEKPTTPPTENNGGNNGNGNGSIDVGDAAVSAIALAAVAAAAAFVVSKKKKD